jgi:short chain dehydrogenase
MNKRIFNILCLVVSIALFSRRTSMDEIVLIGNRGRQFWPNAINFVGAPLSLIAPTFPMLPEFSLQGKVYIVTGGGRGLGVALAGAIIEAGAKKVYCLDLLPEPHEGWNQLRWQLGSQGDALVFKSQNVTDEEGIEKIFEDVVKVEGRLDGLVCAAVLSH